jgi:hypothetical protein
MIPGDFMRLLETGRIELLNKLHGTRSFIRLIETGRIELLNKLHGTRRFYASFRKGRIELPNKKTHKISWYHVAYLEAQFFLFLKDV